MKSGKKYIVKYRAIEIVRSGQICALFFTSFPSWRRYLKLTHLDELKDCLPEGSADILTTVTGFRVIRVL